MISSYHLLECAFWGAAGLTVYTYVGYPVWIYLRSRLNPVPWRQEPILPSVSIILAVHNGEALLARKLDHLLGLDYPQDKIDIIVVSDGSTDGTNRILESFRHPRLRAIILDDHRGKAAALNAGIENARGEILVFIDARPWLQSKALQLLASNFADPRVGCAAGNLILREDGHSAGTKAVTGLYWRLEQWIRNSEAQIDSAIGVYGGFYAVRRELVKALPEGIILDDLLQCLTVVQQGYRCVLDERASVYDTWPKTSRDEFNRKVRTLAGNFQLLQLAPWVLSKQNRLRFELISHKFLRLLVPLLLATMLIASALLAGRSPLYAAALVAQIAMYVLAALGAGRSIPVVKRVAGPANAFCMLNAAVVAGFYKFLFTRGPLWKIWTTTSPDSVGKAGDKAHAAAEVSSAT